ncbi:DUF1697 domain-containing protein [Candidatus Chloroploca sp. Khr17]|uniref:DUF1697 domain-containing protein n=1 Tax=Candidatus Chloroploca sp. Khr17 TaxID=2496869 RepID=UPI00101E20F0|nr:DUF1697 domain-containing protein [Candidatus Chloroploca sp. Khr17]
MIDTSPSMQRWIALLRAINVGGHTVTMAVLRRHIEALGFAAVETMLASGNVILEAPSADASALEAQIAQQLQQALGYPVATFLRSPAEITAIAHHQPFPPTEPDGTEHALSVAFLPTVPDEAAQQRLLALQTALDDLHVFGREVYWRCHTKVSASTFSGARLEQALGMPATIRTITTVRRLAAKYGVDG